jgi:hypothetical protein
VDSFVVGAPSSFVALFLCQIHDTFVYRSSSVYIVERRSFFGFDSFSSLLQKSTSEVFDVTGLSSTWPCSAPQSPADLHVDASTGRPSNDSITYYLHSTGNTVPSSKLLELMHQVPYSGLDHGSTDASLRDRNHRSSR